MTFLEICQKALEDSGLQDPRALKTLEDATELQSDVVNNVREAWTYIQTHTETWGWRHKEFAFLMRPGVDTYAWNELFVDPSASNRVKAIGSFRSWITPASSSDPEWFIKEPRDDYLKSIPIGVLPYYEMRRRRFGVSGGQQRPSYFAAYPDKKLVFHTTPDLAYRIHGLYVAGVQLFKRANEEPIGLNEEYHNLIKWRAVMMLHANDNAPQYQFAKDSYDELLKSLLRIYRPTVRVAGALA